MTGLAGAPVPGLTPLWTHDPVTAGPYRLAGRLGAGGQGVVYLGEDDQGHRVAVKMINVDLSNPRARSQFMKEIAAARRVAPFCTAQVLFADVDGERPYVVSEYIEGPTLYRHVREHGPVAGNALHRLAVGTATALAAIHRSDVVHCDLKPDNVVLGRDGPRVIDFGIARALGVSETVTSQVVGTTAYMAPERFRNDAVGPPCDVFAWGATIAFAAGGRPPFGNDSLFAVMHRVVNEPPDLPPLPADLDELIRQCLAKEPADRPKAEQVLMRLLGQDVRVTGPLRRETVLQVGNETAGAPTPNQPLPLPRSASDGSAGPAPAVHRGATAPTSAGPTPQPEPAATAPTVAGPTPQAHRAATVAGPTAQHPPLVSAPHTSAGPASGGWGRRFRREAVDAWGVSTAIFLGSVGAAAGYVASSAVNMAVATGAATFVVVYLVRLVIAMALGDRSDRP
ncbi:Serine/threonine protein kinase [Micromonospora pallida]|uniref:non-specific serine/threonine protein kinase n=1 Tax=Micromonospora pallida TaxID=145854 RepID=A0A1C6S9S5_9ACTN|nr:serine/threonine-protein kinase [Micromonospora pallida]SCL26225.1 Serine/threonine protein kinase [Micromonospora pallida]